MTLTELIKIDCDYDGETRKRVGLFAGSEWLTSLGLAEAYFQKMAPVQLHVIRGTVYPQFEFVEVQAMEPYPKPVEVVDYVEIKNGYLLSETGGIFNPPTFNVIESPFGDNPRYGDTIDAGGTTCVFAGKTFHGMPVYQVESEILEGKDGKNHIDYINITEKKGQYPAKPTHPGKFVYDRNFKACISPLSDYKDLN